MNKNTIKKSLLPYLALCLIIFGSLFLSNILNRKIHVFSYDEFKDKIESVEEIYITPNSGSSVYTITGKLEGYKDTESFKVVVPYAEASIDRLYELEEQYGFKLSTEKDPSTGTFAFFLLDIIPMLLILGAGFFIITRQVGGANKSMDFGRSRARLSSDNNKVTFKDVAGLDEEKEEVKELIDFLKDPSKFTKMGARIPKGVLLMGPPGTGKTLLARAVAGEANVPFYFISGSEFVELFVGVGASRVRDMFRQAKQTAPCLIFIDEIDAVGRQRGTGLGGGHDEREQTLNQLLTEMDGFGANEGIIIISDTNRPDVLDPALIRPGRFDRQIQVNNPDKKGRKEILEVHARGKKFARNVVLDNIATRTSGFSGADLENLLNEAALLAVRRGKEKITMLEIDEAHDRVLMGPAKKSKKYTENDKRLVAYHEAGHAVLGIKLDGANDVQKITIIPRGFAGGYTMMLPKEERYTSTKRELEERITGLLGGRVAEELVMKEVTTGAQNDFEQATKIARAMVTEYGMSDLGPVQYESASEGSVFLGRDYNKNRNFSSNTGQAIDQAVKTIIEKCYDEAKKILKENRDLLDLLADTLIDKETLTKEEIDHLVEHGTLPELENETLDDIKTLSYKDLSLKELKDIAKEKGLSGYTKMTREELIKELEDTE
ncbi:MAG: ATP-dependent zinc metalloprotease FtsH [Bacilli bacterium]|nr:ATP-dependent zinc metalloprotease FtsH [Bacilli bacterium]